MRQEKTMEILANHVLDPRISLEMNAGYIGGEYHITQLIHKFVAEEWKWLPSCQFGQATYGLPSILPSIKIA
jgi:hypothetical protein